MIFELRTYDLKPAKAPVYLEYFRTCGVGLVTGHLPMLGYWMVDSGRLNRIEHLWAYESYAERDDCRAGLAKNADWTGEFVPRAFLDVVEQTNRFMSLDQASDVFEEVVAGRKAHHENQASDTPMFSPSLHSLTIGQGRGSRSQMIASFKVLSGPEPGQTITLCSGDFDELTQGASGAASHEILRPLSVSPLN